MSSNKQFSVTPQPSGMRPPIRSRRKASRLSTIVKRAMRVCCNTRDAHVPSTWVHLLIHTLQIRSLCSVYTNHLTTVDERRDVHYQASLQRGGFGDVRG